MVVRACLLAAAATLAIGATAAAAEAEPVRPVDPPPSARAAPAPTREHGRRWLPLPRIRLGIPDSGLRALEAERHFFGFHVEFDWGGGTRPRSGDGFR